jgi:hypothetical protein
VAAGTSSDMIVQSPPGTELSLNMVEGSLTLIAFALPFAAPRLGSPIFSKIEHAFTTLARRRGLAVAVVGLAALLLRLALLPFCPIPLPFVPDDFSFLLAADTFLHGRLANPTPAMWIHFESFHITLLPTYTSMYFPAQGLVLAAGKLLFGHPWFGLLAANALMCATICWMLQAWLPPTWALFGGFLAILRLGLFSYWINTYTGAGAIGAIGGALVLGSLPRLMKTTRLRDAVLMAVGIVLLVTTRPYEGLLLCLPVAIVLGRWMLFGKNRPTAAILLRRAALPLALMILAGASMAYYDYRAFGSPTTLPYTVARNAYAVTPYFVWQKQRPTPVYRNAPMQKFYTGNELEAYRLLHSPNGAITYLAIKILTAFLFFGGLALFPPLFMMRRVFLDKRIRFLVWGALLLAAGMAIQIFLLPHYLAPFTAAFYAIGLQAMRHLRVWKAEGKPVGLTIVRLTVVVCVAMVAVRLLAGPLHIPQKKWPPSEWVNDWYGPGYFGGERAKIQSALEQLPGKQLAIVRYTPNHYPLEEWVYNSADIDNSKVIWARELDSSNNDKLIRYYKDRHVWLVQPDATPATLSAFPVPAQLAAIAEK